MPGDEAVTSSASGQPVLCRAEDVWVMALVDRGHGHPQLTSFFTSVSISWLIK